MKLSEIIASKTTVSAYDLINDRKVFDLAMETNTELCEWFQGAVFIYSTLLENTKRFDQLDLHLALGILSWLGETAKLLETLRQCHEVGVLRITSSLCEVITEQIIGIMPANAAAEITLSQIKFKEAYENKSV